MSMIRTLASSRPLEPERAAERFAVARLRNLPEVDFSLPSGHVDALDRKARPTAPGFVGRRDGANGPDACGECHPAGNF